MNRMDPRPEDFKPGEWYIDPQSGIVIYVPSDRTRPEAIAMGNGTCGSIDDADWSKFVPAKVVPA